MQQVTTGWVSRDGHLSARRALGREVSGHISVQAPPITPVPGHRHRQPARSARTFGWAAVDDLPRGPHGRQQQVADSSNRKQDRIFASRALLAQTAPASTARRQHARHVPEGPGRRQHATSTYGTSVTEGAPSIELSLTSAKQMENIGITTTCSPCIGSPLGSRELACCSPISALDFEFWGNSSSCCCPCSPSGPMADEKRGECTGVVALHSQREALPCPSEWSKCDDPGGSLLEVRKAPYHPCVAFACEHPEREREELARLVPALLKPRTRDLFQQIEQAGRHPRRCLPKGNAALASRRCQTPLSIEPVL